MPCGATSNLNYPDYIKRMLKVINVGSDTTLKSCACSLNTPLTSEGCPFVDEDGKVAIFPPYVGCLPETADGDFEMPLEDVMAFVWKAKKIKFTASFSATARYEADDEQTGTLINTLNANTTIFPTKYDETPNPQPLEKMSDLICFQTSPPLVFEETATWSYPSLIGTFVLSGDGGGGDGGQQTWEFEEGLYEPSPLSVKTVGGNAVCDFRYGVLLVPYTQTSHGSYWVSTGAPYPSDSLLVTIPNGAVIKVNGNTYSTDLYFRAAVSTGITITSTTVTGQILIEVESERVAE